jgi:hypothetical protein
VVIVAPVSPGAKLTLISSAPNSPNWVITSTLGDLARCIYADSTEIFLPPMAAMRDDLVLLESSATMPDPSASNNTTAFLPRTATKAVASFGN